ncbi:MAG: sigma-70 family RNA polymerase sigma factor [Planctomycetota bacterium]
MGDLTTGDNPTAALKRFKAEAWPLLPALLRVARMLTRDEHQAEDLVQETMLRACRHIATFQPGTNMKAWLMTILRRTHIDLYRKASRRVDAGSLDAMEIEPADDAADADDDAWSQPAEILNRFDDALIEQALRELPEGMCWTLLLVDVEQMATREAAEVLGVPAGTVKSRASRARAQLRSLLLPLAHQRGWIPHTEEGPP